MQRPLNGTGPTVAETAFVSEMAYLVGDVSLADRASVWPFVCCRGDGGSVSVGEDTNVQEFAMIHGSTLGERVTVGHTAVVDYADVGDDTMIGMQSAVLEGATVESDCLVAAGSVVLPDQTVPAGHLAYGTPAETRPLSEGQRENVRETAAHYVELSRTYLEDGGFESGTTG